MNNFTYPSCCPDYYQKTPTPRSFANQLEAVTSSPSRFKYLSIEKGELAEVGLLERIWNIVKGTLGFENYTGPSKVNSEILKLLHYGMMKGYARSEKIQKVLRTIIDPGFSKKKRIDKWVIKAAQTVLSSLGGKDSIEEIRGYLLDYHIEHQKDLRPSFWNRLSSSVQISPPKSVSEFGKTDLAIAVKAQQKWSQKYRGASPEAIQHFKNANFINNQSEEFQTDFLQVLHKFVNDHCKEHWGHISLLEKEEIYHVVHSLSRNTFMRGKYDDVIQFNKMSAERYPNNVALEALSCRSLIRCNRYEEASKYKEACERKAEELNLALMAHDITDQQRVEIEGDLCGINEDLGDLYFNLKQTSIFGLVAQSPDYEKASQCYSNALVYYKVNDQLGAKTFKALMKTAESKQGGFSLKSLFGIKNTLGFAQVEKATELAHNQTFSDLAQLVKQLEKTGNYRKAIQFYDLAMMKASQTGEPNTLSLNPATYYEAGRGLIDLESKTLAEKEEAIRYLEKAHEGDSQNTKYKQELFYQLSQQGKMYNDAGDLNAAFIFYRKALKYAIGDDKHVRVAFSKICGRLAEEVLDQCRVPRMEYNENAGKKWKEFVEARQVPLSTALNFYNEALAADSSNAWLHFEKGELLHYYELDGHGNNALEEYAEGVKINGKNPYYLLRLSEALNPTNDSLAAEYRDKGLSCATKGFGFRYNNWFKERFVEKKKKVYSIDPHNPVYF